MIQHFTWTHFSLISMQCDKGFFGIIFFNVQDFEPHAIINMAFAESACKALRSEICKHDDDLNSSNQIPANLQSPSLAFALNQLNMWPGTGARTNRP
jgi:hypothetical protein